jgi:hypothetical protein
MSFPVTTLASTPARSRPILRRKSKFMKTRYLALLLVSICGFSSLEVRADGPALINYQGRVVVSNVNFNGTGQFKFALVNSAGTTTYWSNNGTSTNGSEPTAAVSLTVTSGLYSVLLGDTSLGASMTVIPTTVFAQTDLRLRVWFNDGTHGSQLLSPDQRLAPNGYVASSSVSTTNLADGSVTSTKLASAAVGSTQIASGAVGSTQMAAGSVGASQIANSTITAAKISSGQVVKTVNGLTDAVTIAAGSNISITPSGNTLTLAATSGGASVWSLNGTTAFYTGGSVGIGQSSAIYKLEITDTAGFNLGLFGPSPILKFTDTSASNAVSTIRAVSGGVRIGNATSTLADFETSGNVGLGTSSPAYRLHLYDASNSVTQTIETAGGTNSWSRLLFKTNDGFWNVGTSQNFNADELYFFRGNGSTGIQLQLLTNGQLIATTPTGFPGLTHTDGAISVGSYVGGSSSGATGGWLGTFSNHPLYFFVNNGQPSLTIGTDGVTSVKVLSITGGADMAEPFPMQDESVEKGSVVVIDEAHPGHLKRSTRAYDKHVAGIVSGANGINPGIALHQDGALDGGQNVALSGRVYVQADTSNGEINPGDMLTSSDTPGHAMKATDWDRAHGAVIGKAMSPLAKDSGMVLVLVSLQ